MSGMAGPHIGFDHLGIVRDPGVIPLGEDAAAGQDRDRLRQIGDLIRTLKMKGFTVLLVEQNFRFASTIADRHYIVEHGRVVDTFHNAELPQHEDKLHEYRGV